MEYNKEDIHILLIEKISGAISEQDEAFIDKLIREEPAVTRMWHSLRAAFDTPEGREALDPEGHEAFTDRVTASLKKRSGGKIFRNIGYAAAVLALLAGAWSMFWLPRKTHTEKLLVNAPQVILQLGNGRVISLEPAGNRQFIELENTRLCLDSNVLTYTSENNATVNTLSVPAGKGYALILSDGSEIRLNAATTLRFPFTFTGGKREISISGEAYFKIAAKSAQPFIVHTPQSDIEVLGTAFNVNTYGDAAVAVSLIEGAVKVKAGNTVSLLKPGFQAVYHRQKGMETMSFDKSEVLSWLNGEVFFHEATLQEIARMISRCYGITAVLDNPAITSKRFSGVLDRKKPVTAFLEHIQKTSEASYYYKGSILHFK
jgi:hypothetical protein